MTSRIKALAAMALCGIASVFSIQAKAFSDYVDPDGIAHYGWDVVANETNQAGWEFDETGMVSYVYAAEGDTANQRVYNYAIRNLLIDSADEYSISATFTPDPESDLGIERTYGIIPWYQNEDNFLIYWLQQKTDGAWSGQFYGRIEGAFRMIWMPQENASGAIEFADNWRKGEYYDMWWDQEKNSHPAICSQKGAILTNTITLKVVSKLDTCTVGGQATNCRRFELHQIINDVDFISCVFYVKQIDANNGDFKTGLYSEAFNVGISKYTITSNTNFGAKADAVINALPAEITSTEDINKVMDARAAYEGLLSYKETAAADSQAKLDAAEAKIGAYVDAKIDALDETKSTFKDDVTAASELFTALSAELQAKVTKADKLADAIAKLDTWTDPSEKPTEPEVTPTPTPEPTEPTPTPEEKPAKKGCGGSIAASVVAMATLAGAVVVLKKKKDM